MRNQARILQHQGHINLRERKHGVKSEKFSRKVKHKGRQDY